MTDFNDPAKLAIPGMGPNSTPNRNANVFNRGREQGRLLKLPNHRIGDVWPGMEQIGPITILDQNSVAHDPEVNLTRAVIHFHKGVTVFKLDTDAEDRDAPITLEDAENWILSIPKIDSAFLEESGKWKWDAQFYRTGDTHPVTLFAGEVVAYDPYTS